MENSEGNAIHENQIMPISDIDDVSFLFLTPAILLNKKGVKFSFSRRQGKKVKDVKVPFPSYFFYMTPFLLPLFLIYSVPIVAFHMAKKDTKVVHCRNYLSTLVAVFCKLFIGDLKIISDPRGIYPDEGAIIKRWKFGGFSYSIWKRIETWMFQKVDKVFSLSEGMSKYVESSIDNSDFIPAMVDESRFKFSQADRIEVRSNLNIKDDEVVYVYCGSIGLWHNVKLLADAITAHHKMHNGSYKVLILGGADSTKTQLMDFGIENILQLTVKPEKVSKYLSCADIGVLPGQVQSDIYTNTMQTMISSKAEEYLVNGLPILCNTQITEVMKILKQKELDIAFCSKNMLIETGSTFKSNLEKRSQDSEFYSSMFSKSVILEKYNRSYECLCR
ncbi:hypothetical protein EAG18_19710 [Pseudoalteromonas sp. J010]|uniref:hypothetical protein n=1 Tax=Pseudoalteromonas sp. J010 TaxID=998465 RepID=UPI000F64D85A|nr:hypothetical protein [Pseudoalteromonas sp. J010]RRS06909.1 hypothetical protein EAG18_19710 [Pseudoalteromonas sp. J010]